jgi:hypothetical protein
VFAFLRHMSSAPKPKLRHGSIRNGLNLTDLPEPRGSGRPGRRPHVPSSKPTMSKSRRVFSPGSSGSGHRLADLKKARNERETSLGGRVRRWRAIYGRPLRASTGYLQLCRSRPGQAARRPFRNPLARSEIRLRAACSRRSSA